MIFDSLEKLLAHELKDIYSAENQLLKVLPDMAKAASNADLKVAFEDHLKETKNQVKRIEKIMKTMDFAPGGHRCAGMAGLIEEGKDMIDADAEASVRDAGLICAAQRVEHYEIAAYGSAAALAEQLGNREAADVLYESLEEEGLADRKLSRLATRFVNFKAQVA